MQGSLLLFGFRLVKAVKGPKSRWLRNVAIECLSLGDVFSLQAVELASADTRKLEQLGYFLGVHPRRRRQNPVVDVCKDVRRHVANR